MCPGALADLKYRMVPMLEAAASVLDIALMFSYLLSRCRSVLVSGCRAPVFFILCLCPVFVESHDVQMSAAPSCAPPYTFSFIYVLYAQDRSQPFLFACCFPFALFNYFCLAFIVHMPKLGTDRGSSFGTFALFILCLDARAH